MLLKFDFKRFSYRILLSGVFIWIAGFFFYQTTLFDIPPGLNITSPSLIPRLWAIALFVFAIWNLINELREKHKNAKTENLKMLGMIIVALLLYFITIPLLGYFLSTPIFLIAGMYLMKYRHWPVMIINAFGFVLFSYAVFDVLLKIDLPLGNLF